MLKQASVNQIRKGLVGRKDGYIVIGMCTYPRGLRKELHDEYRNDLAPDRALFKDFKHYQKSLGHEEAFQKSDYERRFSLSESGFDHLQYLSDLSKEQDVYLVCQCEVGQRCHREILMLIARRQFGAPIDRIFNRYLCS